MSEQDELPQDDEAPFCTCNEIPTIEESDWGVCHCCGKPLLD